MIELRSRQHTIKKQIITINIPDWFTDAMDVLIDKGLFKSRSGITRHAVKKLLKVDESFFKTLQTSEFEELMEERVQ